MKKFIPLFVSMCIILSGVTTVNAQTDKKVCGNDQAWQQAITLDPSLVLRRQQTELAIEQYIKDQALSRSAADDAVRIIPVVFHVIEAGGAENISDAQIMNQMQIFNLDYRRQNADAVNTPAAFKPVAADAEIEFRLATIDPNGNCTNGIDRVFTNRTNLFDDYGKSIIDWPSDKYFNIWVCKTIGLATGEPGTYVIGYAQFPATGLSGTDGIVLEHDFVGSNIGTAKDNTYSGRDGTHEAGHYFNLIHTWGNAYCGDDQCEDTPTSAYANYTNSNDCTHPYNVINGVVVPHPYPYISCGNDGDMIDNYMDYTDGSCKDIFTLDQKARMRAALDVARFTLWQQSNLVTTGTDSVTYSNPPQCAPNADFLPIHQDICFSSAITYSLNLTNGTPTSWNWSFPGGTPSVSTLSNPTVVYSTPGIYNVTLTASNGQGSSTLTRNNVAIVGDVSGQNEVPFTENFENSLSTDWLVLNDDGGPAWQRTNRASYSGNYSFSVQNFETINSTAPGSVKEFYTPSFDFTNVNTPLLSFRLSYGQQYSGSTDSLSIRATTNCGTSWPELTHLAGAVLASGNGGFQPNNFAPAAHSQWSLVQIQLPSIYSGKNNVKFSFQFITGLLSNNIYIDDINIANGTVGINEEENNGFSFDAFPNPASESFDVSYTLNHDEDLTIGLYDLQGRQIKQIESKHATPGTYQSRVEAKSFNLASGVYLIKMSTNDGVITKKLIYTND